MYKQFVFVITILFATTSYASEYMLLPIDSIYDGDTIKTHVSPRRIPSPLNKMSVRIRGIDTPELPAKSYATTGKLGRSKCVAEAEKALVARDFVKRLAARSVVMKVSNFKWGKFGGRIVADVKINGKNVATELIQRGYAQPYFGGKKTYNWCK